MTWLTAAPYALQLTVVALLLVVDSGLLIGMLLPTSALLALLAAQVAEQPVLLGVTIAIAAASSVLGGCLGYWRAQLNSNRPRTAAVHDASGGRLAARFRIRTSRIADRVGHRLSRTPTAAAAVGQFIAGARTLTPRLAATAGVPLTRVLAGTVPAALLWVTGLVTGGALLSAAADTIGSVVAVIGPILLGPPMLLLGLLPLYLTYRVNRASTPALASVASYGRAG